VSSPPAEAGIWVVGLRAMKQAERKAIGRALTAAGRNRSEAARLLGISRASLYDKLGEHGPR
jgi:DNA-binding NtrC family response regulator